jgi:hypothetical protein
MSTTLIQIKHHYYSDQIVFECQVPVYVENRVIINTTDTSRYEKTHITSETHSCIEIENIRNTNHMNINDFENGVFLISKSEVNSTEIMFSFRGNDTFYFIRPNDKTSSYY